MEKEEILKKAQKENKGKDLAELDVMRKATNIAYMAGGLFIIAILIVNLIVTGVFQYGVLGGLFFMVATAFIYKYIHLRKRHELFVSIIYSLSSLAFLTLWVLQLCKMI